MLDEAGLDALIRAAQALSMLGEAKPERPSSGR